MKTQNLIYCLLALFTITLSSCGEDGLCPRGSGDIISEVRTVSNFNGIEKRGPIDLFVSYGPTYLVSVSADDNLIDEVETRVAGECLIVDWDQGCSHDIHVTVNVTLPYLEYIDSRGSGDWDIFGFDQDYMEIDHTGSGDIEIESDVLEVRIDKTGSGDLLAYGLFVDFVRLSKSGSGDIKITALEEITGSMNGSGDLYYKGDPIVDIVKDGSGDIIDAN